MPGLQYASVTKGIMMLLGIFTLTAAMLDIKPYLHFQLTPHMSKYHQYWRIIVHPLAFGNSTELLMGELLLYNVGVHIERAFGSRKYSSFIIVSTVLSTLLCSVFMILLHPLGIRSIPGGPYGIIFSLLWQYHRIVPSLYQFSLFGITFSQKVFTWIFASQLILSKPPSSILVSLMGLLAGYIYRTDTLFPLPSLSLSRRRFFSRRPLKAYRLPYSLHNFLSRVFSPLIGESAPPRRADRVLPGQVTEQFAGLAAENILGGANLGFRGSARSTLGSIFASRLAAERAQNPAENATTPRDNARVERSSGEPGSTTAAMEEWMSEMTGRSGARAPTEEEIGALRSMFPNINRADIVRALQRNDNNTAQAVEALLESVQ
ncbi:uncharacterized protein L203_100350 [Cryptococcus depauperatus CBS 7841]|uniref:Uncharacterized protein n=1 Tax=Cryptococcus depauperatus CBS 7841 TaxID=1295531 RepID=A0A1E3I0D3_9TREE|nr:hypothetical protein L203_05777 [Cryptococcus depauperatus CBS 7841]